MDSLQKEALMRSAQQIANENGGFEIVTDITLHENSEKGFDQIGKTNIVWVDVWTNDEAYPHDYAITGWRYLKNLNDVIAEQREERMKELGI